MTMNLEIVVLVILCIGGCNAGVVLRNFKSNEFEHISMEKKGSTEIPGSTQNKILSTVDTVERNNISEHLKSASKSISTHLSDDLKINSSNSIPNVKHDDEIIQDRDSINEDLGRSDSSGLESNSTSGNISESGLRIANALETLRMNPTLNNTDFIKELNITKDSSADISENASNFIVDINKTTSIQNHLVDLNETFLGHEMKFNGTNFFPLKFLANETDTSMPQDLNILNISEKFEIPIVEKLKETKTSGGIFSGTSLDFLINSEVARNAAKAIEVFNFTDPLTDHIFEANEFHSFLDTKLPTLDVDSDSPYWVVNQDETEITFPNNGTEILGNSTLADNETVLQSEPEISFNTTDSTKTDSIQLESNVSELQKRNEPQLTSALAENDKLELFNLTNAMAENLTQAVTENETELLHLTLVINLTETLNETEELNLTRIIGEKTLEQLNKEPVEDLPVLENENLKVINSTAMENSSEKVETLKCPPPGFCILWFWSQDACEVDSHCLGSRICCRVRCSKTCIDVEKLS